ncbi:MAG TPA: RNA polymerase sigma factor [Ktedonosporobacter sp.]|nr:RNA polymerase sigma factor [Ktedonosporobacter sp.]
MLIAERLSDEELMVEVLMGKQEALTALVERHYSLLLGYLYRLLNEDRFLAEDMVQETFLRLMQRGGYQPGRAFKPWLYAIATNLARDHFKSAAVRHAVPQGEEAMLAMSDTRLGPEEQALVSEEGRLVAQALAYIKEEYRVVLLLRFYNGMSLQEIATTLHIPSGTVKSRLSVGTQRLRELLVCMRREEVKR